MRPDAVGAQGGLAGASGCSSRETGIGMTKRAIIIGAGPAGLTAGRQLIRRSDICPLLLQASGEREAEDEGAGRAAGDQLPGQAESGGGAGASLGGAAAAWPGPAAGRRGRRGGSRAGGGCGRGRWWREGGGAGGGGRRPGGGLAG